MVAQAYRARKPKASPSGSAVGHFDAFLACYENATSPSTASCAHHPGGRQQVPRLRRLERGFARVRCEHCRHEYLLAFSCKGRWFCPSCHQKKASFRRARHETILFPVPHRTSPSHPRCCARIAVSTATCLRPSAYRPRVPLRLHCRHTQHIPDKSFQLVRYYGWYSNKMRGQRDKQAAETAQDAGKAVEVIDVSTLKPRRIPQPTA